MLSNPYIAQVLLQHRRSLVVAAWIAIRDAHIAEDVFQEVVVRALERPEHFQTEAHLIAWARKTLRNRSFDLARKQDGRVLLLEPALIEQVGEYAHKQQDLLDEELVALRECLGRQSTDARRILAMRYVNRLTCEEVAEKAGLSLAGVYQRLSRLHRRLADCISRKLAPEGTSI